MARRSGMAGWMIRAGGAVILVVAALATMRLVAIGAGHSAHEPASAYALAWVTFWGANVGVATLAWGRRLTSHVVVAERWLPHVPLAFREEAERRTDSPAA